MLRKVAFLLIIVVLCSFSILCITYATAAPKAQIVKEVVDFFYNGEKEGPVLTDAKLCKKVESMNCKEKLDLNSIPMGDPLKVWMQFFVPKGAIYDDIFVEYKHEGMPRHLKAHKVEGSIRYRVVDTHKPDKPGNWTITIKKGVTNLKLFNIKVVSK